MSGLTLCYWILSKLFCVMLKVWYISDGMNNCICTNNKYICLCVSDNLYLVDKIRRKIRKFGKFNSKWCCTNDFKYILSAWVISYGGIQSQTLLGVTILGIQILFLLISFASSPSWVFVWFLQAFVLPFCIF